MNIKNNLIDPNKKHIIAVSGGIDSMVLLDVIQKHLPKKNIIVITIDHKTRNESEIDALFVKQYCDQNNIYCEIKPIVETRQCLVSTEEYLRNERYTILKKSRQEHNAKYIITAHHLNDRLETFIFRMFRGTGLHGLMSPREIEGNICRPLLHLSKQEVTEYAKNNNINWREDQTNTDEKYTRNFIRHSIIAKLKNIHPNFLENFAQLFEDLQAWDAFHKDCIHEWMQKHPSPFDKKDFLELPAIIQTEILQELTRPYGQTLTRGHIREILSIIKGNVGNKYVELKAGLKVFVKGGKVWITG